jgi:hypothetical protein
MGLWLVLVMLAVLFTPSFRVMGTVPVRADDVLIFFGFGYYISKRLVLLKMPRLDSVAFSSFLVIASIAVSTLFVSLSSSGSITAKEYLDVVRPLKWLFLYWIVADIDATKAMKLILRTLYISWAILLALCILEIVLGRFFPNMALAQFLASFRNGGDWDAVSSYMDKRPFATLESPTSLGYLATIGIFLSQLLEEKRKRRIFAAISSALLILTMTRTFFFALPLLFVCYEIARSDNWKTAIKGALVSIRVLVVLLLVALVVMPIISPSVTDLTFGVFSTVSSGNATEDFSIGNRIANLSLVVMTWNQAPLLGVATRAYLPDFVDSELIITFHRYGLFGLCALLSVYPAGMLMAWRMRRQNREMAASIMTMLMITFLYGITQGALINSREGVIPYIILGVLSSAARCPSGRPHRDGILSLLLPSSTSLIQPAP